MLWLGALIFLFTKHFYRKAETCDSTTSSLFPSIIRSFESTWKIKSKSIRTYSCFQNLSFLSQWHRFDKRSKIGKCLITPSIFHITPLQHPMKRKTTHDTIFKSLHEKNQFSPFLSCLSNPWSRFYFYSQNPGSSSQQAQHHIVAYNLKGRKSAAAPRCLQSSTLSTCRVTRWPGGTPRGCRSECTVPKKNTQK